MQWYFQHTANDNHDYDSVGSQILIDGKVNNEDRKLIIHATATVFHYTVDRLNGHSQGVQYAAKVTWTRASIRNGKPVDYDPNKDVQIYNHDWKGGVEKFIIPALTFTAAQFLAAVLQPQDEAPLCRGNEAAPTSFRTTAHVRQVRRRGYVNEARITGGLAVVDPTRARSRRARNSLTVI